jgi:hypothetical protein
MATNVRLINLHELLYLPRGEPLAIIFQAVTVRAYSTAWYYELHKILELIKARWVTVAVSFIDPTDLIECWNIWPLVGNNVSDLRIWVPVKRGGASGIPLRFLHGSKALERLELRNLAWVHHASRGPIVGPSVNEVLGSDGDRFVHIVPSLALLDFETPLWTWHHATASDVPARELNAFDSQSDHAEAFPARLSG